MDLGFSYTFWTNYKGLIIPGTANEEELIITQSTQDNRHENRSEPVQSVGHPETTTTGWKRQADSIVQEQRRPKRIPKYLNDYNLYNLYN